MKQRGIGFVKQVGFQRHGEAYRKGPSVVLREDDVQGGPKNVIPLVQCNVMYERYHFIGPPCRWPSKSNDG